MLSLVRWGRIPRVRTHPEYATDRVGSSRHLYDRLLHFHGFGYDFVCLPRAGFSISAVDAISDNSIDGAHTGNIIGITDSFAQKPVSNLPSKHGRVGTLVIRDFIHNGTCCYLGLASTDYPRPYGTSLVESAQNLAHTAMGNPQLA